MDELQQIFLSRVTKMYTPSQVFFFGGEDNGVLFKCLWLEPQMRAKRIYSFHKIINLYHLDLLNKILLKDK